MLDETLLSHCRAIAHRIAPELREHPLYVVDGSTLGDLPAAHRDCLGWAFDGTFTNYDLRERIGQGWQGPGPVVCLLPQDIEAEWGPEHFRDGVLNTLLHELGHVLPPAKIPQDDFADLFDVPALREWQRQKWAEADARPAPVPGTADDPHDWQFIRRVCHLWARAKRAGWDIPSIGLFGGSLWFVCQPAHWITALFRELVDMQDATFAQIQNSPPPDEFMQMWEGALQFHFHRETKTR